jgi:hypothetical protein
MVVTERVTWWRRSRWALLSLVVLVPAAVAAALSIDAVDYLASRPSVVTTIDAGERAELGGAELRVVDSWIAPSGSAAGERYAVPDGTALVSVTLELDAQEASEEFRCSVKLLEPGRDRRWTSSYTDTDYFPGRDLPDDVPTGCSWAEAAFPFEVTFLIPEDAADAVVIEAFTPDQLPTAFHLRLS